MALWLILIGIGYSKLLAHHWTAGPAGSPPVDWPGSTLVSLDRDRPTLLVFVHPRCPCSAASLAELGQALALTGGEVEPYVVEYRPEKMTTGWEIASKDRRLSIDPCRRVLDRCGVEARRFGVETSGHVLLYGTDGRLRFSGGITAGRGHQGPNPGADLLVEMILGRASESPTSPVHGCPVLAPRKNPTPEVEP